MNYGKAGIVQFKEFWLSQMDFLVVPGSDMCKGTVQYLLDWSRQEDGKMYNKKPRTMPGRFSVSRVGSD